MVTAVWRELLARNGWRVDVLVGDRSSILAGLAGGHIDATPCLPPIAADSRATSAEMPADIEFIKQVGPWPSKASLLCDVVLRGGLDQDEPQVDAWFHHFTLSADDYAELIKQGEEHSDPVIAAQHWLDEHPRTVTSWLD